MDARHYNGGPDDEAPVYRRDDEPPQRQCDWCEDWTREPVDYCLIWFFCDSECRDSWLAAEKRKASR